MQKKRSFFERLTGTVSINEGDDNLEQEISTTRHNWSDPADQAEEEGELAVDVYQTPSEMIIKAMVSGVKPEDLQISISRDMVTIQGKRQAETAALEGDYFYKELYWGSFSRSILLPQEVDTDAAEATEKHGLLTIRLPKIDKEKVQKVRVKSS